MQEEYAKWRNETVEHEVQFVQKVVHCLRSAQTDYNLPKSRLGAQGDSEKSSATEKPEAEGKNTTPTFPLLGNKKIRKQGKEIDRRFLMILSRTVPSAE